MTNQQVTKHQNIYNGNVWLFTIYITAWNWKQHVTSFNDTRNDKRQNKEVGSWWHDKKIGHYSDRKKTDGLEHWDGLEDWDGMSTYCTCTTAGYQKRLYNGKFTFHNVKAKKINKEILLLLLQMSRFKWRHHNRCRGTLQSLPIKMLHDSCLNDGALSVSRKRFQITVSQMTDGKDET